MKDNTRLGGCCGGSARSGREAVDLQRSGVRVQTRCDSPSYVHVPRESFTGVLLKLVILLGSDFKVSLALFFHNSRIHVSVLGKLYTSWTDLIYGRAGHASRFDVSEFGAL